MDLKKITVVYKLFYKLRKLNPSNLPAQSDGDSHFQICNVFQAVEFDDNLLFVLLLRGQFFSTSEERRVGLAIDVIWLQDQSHGQPERGAMKDPSSKEVGRLVDNALTSRIVSASDNNFQFTELTIQLYAVSTWYLI